MSLRHREILLYYPGLAYYLIGVAGLPLTQQDSYIEETME
jgi:hypothetical protein